MKKIKITKIEFNKIKSHKQTQIILKELLETKEEVLLCNKNDSIQVEITSVAKFNNLKDCFKVIPIDLFGVKKESSLSKKYDKYDSINAYRVKYDDDEIEKINDKELLNLIKSDTLKKNNIGHSSVNIYEVECNNGDKAILKIQSLSTRNNLEDEYERIKWLQGKCNVPKLYYYKEKGNKKYLLMEKKEGTPVYKSNDFAFQIGKFLKQIHNIDITNCKFNQNSVEKLLKNALDNIDEIYPQVKEAYPDMSKKDVIDFLKNKMPKDKVLVHGDYSLPNILMDENGKLSVIDLGDVSISSKYFDLFYLLKSMKRNKKMDYWDDLLKGYGINKLDEESLKWIEIIDKALF